jgi:hypothetical protein
LASRFWLTALAPVSQYEGEPAPYCHALPVLRRGGCLSPDRNPSASGGDPSVGVSCGRGLIEAKLTEDDGTARDKVARVQRLRTLRDQTGHTYDVIACIAGRGFKVRREDMRRLLQATDGKVFTLTTMHLLWR